MPWFRLDDNFDTHPKVIAAGNEAIGLYIRCGAYAARNLTDGFIGKDVALLYGSDELAATLVRVKLWHRARGGWTIHDYLDYNPTREEVIHKREIRASAGRKGGIESGNTRRQRSDQHKHPPPGEAKTKQMLKQTLSKNEPRPGPVPVSMADVVNRLNGGNPPRANPEVIEAIIREILDVTGKHITEEWAGRVASHILQGQPVASPAAYCRQAIRNDPNPRQRFLPVP